MEVQEESTIPVLDAVDVGADGDAASASIDQQPALTAAAAAAPPNLPSSSIIGNKEGEERSEVDQVMTVDETDGLSKETESNTREEEGQSRVLSTETRDDEETKGGEESSVQVNYAEIEENPVKSPQLAESFTSPLKAPLDTSVPSEVVERAPDMMRTADVPGEVAAESSAVDEASQTTQDVLVLDSEAKDKTDKASRQEEKEKVAEEQSEIPSQLTVQDQGQSRVEEDVVELVGNESVVNLENEAVATQSPAAATGSELAAPIASNEAPSFNASLPDFTVDVDMGAGPAVNSDLEDKDRNASILQDNLDIAEADLSASLPDGKGNPVVESVSKEPIEREKVEEVDEAEKDQEKVVETDVATEMNEDPSIGVQGALEEESRIDAEEAKAEKISKDIEVLPSSEASALEQVANESTASTTTEGNAPTALATPLTAEGLPILATDDTSLPTPPPAIADVTEVPGLSVSDLGTVPARQEAEASTIDTATATGTEIVIENADSSSAAPTAPVEATKEEQSNNSNTSSGGTTIEVSAVEPINDTTKPQPAVSAPTADLKLAVTAAPLSPGGLSLANNAAVTAVAPTLATATDPEADKIAAKQVAMVPLVLKINKELIRLCVDLQGKDLGSDVLFKDAALRLQSNLAFLASIADRSTKNPTSVKDTPSTPLNDEPFPPTLHAPESMLPKLYQLLQSFRSPSLSNSLNVGEATEGTKRGRTDSQEGKRKKTKEQQQRQQSSDSNMSTSTSMRQPQQSHMQQQQQQQQQGMASPASMVANMPTVSTTLTPPRQNSESNGTMTGAAPSNGMMSNPQQIQNLTQAFGQNAMMNLNALQSHYRGQPQAVVSYMEANIPGFRNLPIQMQLQQMTNIQNAALQRQRQQQQQQHQQQQQQAAMPIQNQQGQALHLRRSSAAQSPSADSPNARMGNRNTQSPMPMATASPGTPLQQQGRPGTPASQNIFAHMGSPAASAASPASHLMASASGMSYPSPQSGMTAFSMPGGANQSMAPMMANVPAHLQQQFLQQLQQQQSFSPSNAFSPPQNQANGNMWPPPPSS